MSSKIKLHALFTGHLARDELYMRGLNVTAESNQSGSVGPNLLKTVRGLAPNYNMHHNTMFISKVSIHRTFAQDRIDKSDILIL